MMDLIRASLHSFEDSVDSIFLVSVLEVSGQALRLPTPPHAFFFFFLDFVDLQGILEE